MNLKALEHMRVIFSRKGFDSAAGGCASPIVNGECLSLPIPTSMPTPISYAELNGPYADLVQDLTRGRIKPNQPCHLDPDIHADMISRHPNWHGALGQVGTAQSHLERTGVEIGDLFLFWGLFRPVKYNQRWVFDGPAEHRIFGWLQVGEVIHLGCDGSRATTRHPWLVDHPHVRAGWSEKNTLYIASDEVVLNKKSSNLPGWGKLRSGFRLTTGGIGDDVRPGLWNAPAWLNPKKGGAGMTYHRAPERWDDETVQVVSRGQEFVAHTNGSDEAVSWIHRVLHFGVTTDA